MPKRKFRFNLETYQPMPVIYQLRYSILEKIKRGEDPLSEIDGREKTKEDVVRAILSGTHPYLVSEEGTGKTRLARSLTRLLPPIPIIKGCPYNDDPKWPLEWLCPRCREKRKNSLKEGDIEFVSGEKRFSRIQGNEYTNEAKLLGLKDIQAIVQGKSPSDPGAFTGTGVFRANRGILFIDELPAIRTKVQVLLHPILEEKKVILEEYNWQRPVDLLLIATGNPRGFSHVNEIPRPLLDRLELIYMDLPEEAVEKRIMLKERFRVKLNDPFQPLSFSAQKSVFSLPQSIERKVAAPWWIMDLINKAVRYTRKCSRLEKRASIRGTNRAIDHTYASAEMENRWVANLKDASQGLKLALRGRISLRPDLIDFERPKESFRQTDEIVEGIIQLILEEDLAREIEEGAKYDREKLSQELNSLLEEGGGETISGLSKYEEIKKILDWMKEIAPEKAEGNLLNERERKLFYHPDKVKEKILKEYHYSALEVIISMATGKGMIDELLASERAFVPQKFPQRLR